MKKPHFLLTALVAVATFLSLHALAGHRLHGYFGGHPGFLRHYGGRWERPFSPRHEAGRPALPPLNEVRLQRGPGTPPVLPIPPAIPADSLPGRQ